MTSCDLDISRGGRLEAMAACTMCLASYVADIEQAHHTLLNFSIHNASFEVKGSAESLAS